jgi:AcrR family transcriptional regulator
MSRAGLSTDKLTRAAAELADEHGLEAVTASALARRFEVRTASIYSHVGGTPDLRRRVALLALAESADRLADALAGRAGRDAVIALGDTYRDYARQHPGRYAAMRLPLDPETAAASAGPRHAELLRAVLRGYGFDAEHQTHATRLVASLVHGFTSLELGGGFDHSAPDAGSTWTVLLDALDTLLTTWTPGATR